MDPADSVAIGKAARSLVPRSRHGEWAPSSTRTDPVAILLRQATTRQPDLVPLRHTRMLASPFAFYRGGAAIMAEDLAQTPTTGIEVQCCGDAHLANFGGFESPERRMVFDINDFDETLPGPWEWDVKRLAASLVIAARDREFGHAVGRQLVAAAMRQYREAMREFATMRNLDVWYARLDLDGILRRWGSVVSKSGLAAMQRSVDRARAKDNLRGLAKLTERVDGEVRIRNDPPLVERFDHFLPPGDADQFEEMTRRWLAGYSRTLEASRRHFLAGYRVVDVARKVVGVGSVGTRCWIALLLGRDDGDPLFLQVKEAEQSVLESHVHKSKVVNHGERVVQGQHLMQAVSDIFLGWDRGDGFDGVARDFYVRQLWDGKLSANLATIDVALLQVYAQMCGWTLARAHARSGDRIAIGAYLGSGASFDNAIVEFAVTYADQNQRDYDAALDASRTGKLAVC